MNETNYLPKPIPAFPTRWALATTAEEFYALQNSDVDIGYHDAWSYNPERNYGLTHYYDRFIIVCMPLDVPVSTVVHESVHVFQTMMRDAGEVNPGLEVQAYCIQFIFETLTDEIERRKKCATETLA